MEHIETVLRTIAVVIDLVGIAILLFGALKFIVHYLGLEIKRMQGFECVKGIRNLRLGLGSYILLSLEFMIISDVVNAALSRNIDDVLLLGLIIIIRTALGVFLGRELNEIKAHEVEDSST